jgi:hypothetical protein
MKGAHGQFCEVLQLLGGDARGGQLADDLLNACFDLTLPDSGEEKMKSLDHLMSTLACFNAYVRRSKESPVDSLYSGTPEEVAVWAEDLTQQIWENRPN